MTDQDHSTRQVALAEIAKIYGWTEADPIEFYRRNDDDALQEATSSSGQRLTTETAVVKQHERFHQLEQRMVEACRQQRQAHQELKAAINRLHRRLSFSTALIVAVICWLWS